MQKLKITFNSAETEIVDTVKYLIVEQLAYV
jgi:hypothetical protein